MKPATLKTFLAGASALGILAGGAANAQEEIVVGMAVAQTGWMEAYDGEGTKMAQMYFEKLNEEGGLLGKQIKVLVADTKTDRVEGAKVGQTMVQEGADLMLVSADYDYGAPAALQAQKAGIVSFFLGASDPKAGVLGVGPFSFTSANAAQLEGATMADWGYQEKGFRKGYSLVDESIEYNKSICAGYDWIMGAKDDAEIVGTDTFKGLDPVISTQITRMSDAIASGGVDHIMLCSTNPGAASALRQIRAAGIDLPVFGGTSMDGSYWTEAVPGLKDFYVPSLALTKDDPRASVNEVTEAYAAKYGAGPASQYAYLIYGMLDMWVAAVKEAETTDAAAVVEVMNGFDSFETTVGLRKLTPELHIQTEIPMLVTSYEGGEQTLVTEWSVGMPIPQEVLYRLAK